jgi:hypothetical protein
METNMPEGAPPSKPGPGSTQNLTSTTTSTGSAENLSQEFQSVQDQLKQLFRQAADAGTVPESVLSSMQALTAKLGAMSAGVTANAATAGQLSSNAAVSSNTAFSSNAALSANAAGSGTSGAQSGAFYSQLEGIPIDYLITTPLISAARGNIALATVMIDFVNTIGFNSDGSTNVVQFILDQPYQVPDAATMSYLTQTVTVTAPLLSLVPLPALLVQNVTVDLAVQISNVIQQGNTASDTATAGATASASARYGFASATFTGTYSNTNSTTATNNQTASQAAQYTINVVAEQQPPTAGMLALSQCFANCIVPVSNGS